MQLQVWFEELLVVIQSHVIFTKETPLSNPILIITSFLQAIETGVGYGQWLHGEAVAAGMVWYPQFSVFLIRLPLFSQVCIHPHASMYAHGCICASLSLFLITIMCILHQCLGHGCRHVIPPWLD